MTRFGVSFQPVEPLLDLAELVPHGAEFGHDVGVPRIGRRIRGRNPGDEVAALLMGLDQPLGAEHLEPVPDGHRGDAVRPGQLALDRQPAARRVPPGRDRRAQVGGDLLVRGDRAVAADRHRHRLPTPAARARRAARSNRLL